MKNKSAGVAKVVALAVVPLILGVVVAKIGQQRRAEAATQQLFVVSDPVKMESLLAQGANPDTRDEEGKTPLHLAMSSKPSEGCVGALLNYGANVNAKDHLRRTPLLYAVHNADPVTVGFLLGRGADVQARAQNGERALSSAQSSLAGLLRGELNENAQGLHSRFDEDYHVASIKNHRQVIQMLKAAGAKE